MKGFNKKIFALAAAITMMLTISCWAAIEEHNKDNSFDGIWGAITVLSSILRFPVALLRHPHKLKPIYLSYPILALTATTTPSMDSGVEGIFCYSVKNESRIRNELFHQRIAFSKNPRQP